MNRHFGKRRTRDAGQASYDAGTDRLLNVEEAAALLGLKPSTLYTWASERRIATIKPAMPAYLSPQLREEVFPVGAQHRAALR